MLTTWKQALTTFEYPKRVIHHSTNKSSLKKKTKQRKSIKEPQDSNDQSSHEEIWDVSGIAASFVTPRTDDDGSSFPDSKRIQSKKRKIVNSDGKEGNAHYFEPKICLTSLHRVAFLGEAGTSDDIGLSENKSRSYLSRPGVAASFYLENTNKCLSGMISPGAQYQSLSNLVYAIRNGGAELAIWSAASSSLIQGPDDNLSTQTIDAVEKETAGSRNHKKRKSYTREDSPPLFDLVVCERLVFPEGKVAVTLTPFHINEENQKIVVVGAAGCCTDGSIWIAMYQNVKGDRSFKLVVVDGSSVIRGDKMEVKPSPIQEKTNTSVVLNSRVVGLVNDKSELEKDSYLIGVQSVMQSTDDCGVVIRYCQIRIADGDDNKNGIDSGVSSSLQCHIETDVRHSISGVSTQHFVAAKFDIYGRSLWIVSQQDDNKWIFKLIELSPLYYKSSNTPPSFDLTCKLDRSSTLFSFGSLGNYMFATLIKKQVGTSDSSLFSLKVVDVRRKVELSCMSWMEGSSVHPHSTDHHFTNILNRRICNSMITNELDGSIALLTSSIENGSIYIMTTKVATNSTSHQSEVPHTSTTSLASALKAVALSEHRPHRDPLSIHRKNIHVRTLLGSKRNITTQQNHDEVIDLACKTLSQGMKSIIDVNSEGSDFMSDSIMNGENKNGLIVKKSVKQSRDWIEAFQEGISIIKSTKSQNFDNANVQVLKNGITSNSTTLLSKMSVSMKDLPRRYTDAAFNDALTILASLQRKEEASPAYAPDKLEEVFQDALGVLLEALRSGCIFARVNHGFNFFNEAVFLHMLKAYSAALVPYSDSTQLKVNVERDKMIGPLDILDAFLNYVNDIPERVLVFMLRFVLRDVSFDDAISYYSKNSVALKKNVSPNCLRLAEKYFQLTFSDTNGGTQEELILLFKTRLLAETVLDFTSKIVKYSKCNHSILCKSMQDCLNSDVEVETLSLTLTKLLESGDGQASMEGLNDKLSSRHGCICLCLGVIDWISAILDAHMSTILKIVSEGGFLIERMLTAIRSALVQAETASVLKEMSDHLTEIYTKKMKQSDVLKRNPRLGEDTIAPYTIERLVL